MVVRTGNIIFSGGGSYFRLEQRTGEARLGATNGIATNAYMDLGVNNGNPTTSFNGTLDLFGFNQTLVGVENISNQGVTITYPKLQAEHVDDAFDDTILQAEDVAHVGGYGVGGELSSAGRIDEAVRDPDPVTRLL